MGVDLNNEVRRTRNPHVDGLWDHVYNSFRRNFADLQEQERAEDTLRKGIHMEGDKFDEFAALFERLTTEAGYDRNSRLALKFFTDGLPHELYRDTLRLDRPRNYNNWKVMAGERQVEWVHCNNQKKQIARNQQASKLYNPWTPSHRRRNPNATDTSADRGRANTAETYDHDRPETDRKGQAPMPPFAPREGYIRKQAEQRDMRGVQCYNCQKFRHFARNCFQK